MRDRNTVTSSRGLDLERPGTSGSATEWGSDRVLPLLFVVLTAILGLGLVGCGDRANGADDAATEGEAVDKDAIPVEVAALARGPIEAVLRFSADLEAEESVPVVSRAAHRVLRLLVEEGDRVTKGALLATLEAEEQRNAVAKIDSQLTKARRDYERQRSLFDQALISEQTFIESRYELEQLEINLVDAKRELSYTEVRAPISGTVTQRLVSLGDQVTVNQHLFDIVDFDSLVVRLFVPERDLSRVKVGQEARLSSQALPGRAFFGTVERIAPIVDPRTGTIKVTVKVPQETGLLPGLFLEAQLVTAVRSDALLVPKRSLVLDEDQAFVFRLDDEGRVEKILARAVLEDSAWIEVIEGLAEGDRVVVAGQAGLKDGDLVR
ncbi:MAG: efflux RND transporter periplasmic adaptor subunit, partial [Thermoanaerobaculia bacterium]|nr:efflux RND transporter periplasmic adaptor subunit [Thermoanaerobaculia bacterium]